jgi:hypothetical protein
MTPKHPIVVTPASNAERLNSSIVQFTDLILELTTIGLDQARHQPTGLQNRLLQAACTSLEAWVEIQKGKLAKVEAQVRVLPDDTLIYPGDYSQ